MDLRSSDGDYRGRGRESKESESPFEQEEEELESMTLSNEGPSRARQLQKRQQQIQQRRAEPRDIRSFDSNFSLISRDEGKASADSRDSYDDEDVRYRLPSRRRAQTEDEVYVGDEQGEDEIESRAHRRKDVDSSPSPPSSSRGGLHRRQNSSQSNRSQGEDLDREDEEDVGLRPKRSNSSNSGKRFIKPAGSIPLPSNAPPRRARDALAEAEATQKTRRSIDEVLFKRGSDSKTVSRENSARNSVQSATPREGDSSSDEEFDLKVG